MFINTLLAWLPLVLSAGAIIALRTGWRKPSYRHRMMMPVASLLVVAAIKLWAQRVGIEFAVVYTFLTLTFTAWLTTTSGVTFKAVKRTPPALPKQFLHTSSTHKVVTFIVAGPLTLVAACLVTIALASLLPIARNEQLIMGAFVYPLLIAVTTYWLCSSDRLVRKGLLLLATSGASGAYLFL